MKIETEMSLMDLHEELKRMNRLLKNKEFPTDVLDSIIREAVINRVLIPCFLLELSESTCMMRLSERKCFIFNKETLMPHREGIAYCIITFKWESNEITHIRVRRPRKQFVIRKSAQVSLDKAEIRLNALVNERNSLFEIINRVDGDIETLRQACGGD